MKVLLAAGSGVEVLDGSGGTPLNMSVRFSSAATTEAILAHGCNVNPTNGDGVTPLHVAAEKGKCAHVALLLKYGADVHATHPGGHTALHFAALYGHAEVVRMLLEKGSAIDATNSGGMLMGLPKGMMRHTHTPPFPLFDVFDMSYALLAGWTPLHAAVRFGRHGAVAALVAAGADKRRKTDEGVFCQMLHVLFPLTLILSLLLCTGKSAIFLAHEKGNDADMMALLR